LQARRKDDEKEGQVQDALSYGTASSSFCSAICDIIIILSGAHQENHAGRRRSRKNRNGHPSFNLYVNHLVPSSDCTLPAKCLELFMKDLITKTAAVTTEKKGRTITLSHLYVFIFLYY
jgi:hypothetical protein